MNPCVKYTYYIYVCIYICSYICICIYLIFSNQSTGGWSTEGIIQDNDASLPILCNTTHLTSFCILVSTREAEV